mmetsp:Transcript_33215/g.72472  ORF Transcript_33215/g.72472 Transcript_33215/m.72472 type:complete len:93 (+) Transcript_33215:77-355(+)
MTTVFKRLPIGGATKIFKAEKVYRPGSAMCASPAIASLSVQEALATAKVKVDFLEVATLKGLPVAKDISTKTIDPYLAGYIRDVRAAYFAKK